MKDQSYTLSAANSVAGSDIFGSYYNPETSRGEKEFLSLFDVSSVSNPKPWSNAHRSPQHFKKFVILNGPQIDHSGGTYILKPYFQSTWTYGRRDNSSDAYRKGFLLEDDVGRTRERAYSKFLDKVRGEHANLATDLAEGRQTYKMVRDATHFRLNLKKFLREVVLERNYKKIRRGPTQGQRQLDYVTGRWLEYRYGWMPLLSSIWQTFETTLRKNVLLRKTVQARSGSVVTEVQRSGSGSFHDPSVSLRIEHSTWVEYGGDFELPTGFNIQDYTNLNPLSIAWELTPLSFVADWFVNIGDVLESFENYVTYANRFTGGYVTTSVKERRIIEWSGSNSYPQQYYYSAFLDEWLPSNQVLFERKWKHSTVEYTEKDRTLFSSLPIPGGPRVKVNLNSKRMLDAASLISQYVKRFR